MRTPNGDVDPDDIGPGANLRGKDLSKADLSGANLREADLADADLSKADLSGANLREADLSRANLRGADLSGASLLRSDLTGVNLSGADLTDVDLREATFSEITVSRGTVFRQSTQADYTAQDWGQIANIYCDLAIVFEENGVPDQARQFRALERSAIANREKAAGNIISFSFIKILFTRSVFDIGVAQVSILMILLYTFSTLYYIGIGIQKPFYYSIVVFTTSASATQGPLNILTRFVVIIETFGGTLLIVLLGAVISSRIN